MFGVLVILIDEVDQVIEQKIVEISEPYVKETRRYYFSNRLLVMKKYGKLIGFTGTMTPAI